MGGSKSISSSPSFLLLLKALDAWIEKQKQQLEDLQKVLRETYLKMAVEE